MSNKLNENSIPIKRNYGWLKQVTERKIFSLIALIVMAIVIRMYYFVPEIPLTFDALSHFFYAFDIATTGKLPTNYSPANNGWPIVISFFFKFFSFNEVIEYMQLQRWISIIFSSITCIPVYFLSRNFFGHKIAIICTSILIFEPRLILNSLLGITESLYIFLVSWSMVLFLSDKRKIMILAFGIVGISSLVRSEGLFLFIGMSVMFLIKYRKDGFKNFKNYFIVLTIFLTIIIPMSIYRSDVIGNDQLFGRVIETSIYVSQDPGITNSKSGLPYMYSGIENFVKFLGWNLIPTYIIFIPLGIIIFLRNLNLKKISIIVISIFLSLPALHAYGGTNLDSRYLFTLYPIFSVITGFTIQKIFQYSSRENFILLIIIVSVLIISISFFELNNMNLNSLKEYNQISKDIITFEPIINDFYPASAYIETAIIPNESKILEKYFFDDRKHGISIRDKFTQKNNLVIMTNVKLEEFLLEAQEKSLTHLAIDLGNNRPVFFRDIYENEQKYPFLKKIYDSNDHGFNYKIKIFEINYQILQK